MVEAFASTYHNKHTMTHHMSDINTRHYIDVMYAPLVGGIETQPKVTRRIVDYQIKKTLETPRKKQLSNPQPKKARRPKFQVS